MRSVSVTQHAALAAITFATVVLISVAPVVPNNRASSLIEPATIVQQSTVDSNLRKAFLIGREVGHPETLQGIMLQETRAGNTEMVGNRASPVGKRSYGLMQVQVIAAKAVFANHPELFARYFKRSAVTDEEIIALLLTDDDANIRIAAYHFKSYFALSKGDWHRAVAAYNTGIGGVRQIQDTVNFPYVIAVKQHMRDQVGRFNHRNGLR